MAEAFLQIVLENLNSLIKEEIGLIMGVDDDMQKLFSSFTTIQAVLEDAEEKQLKSIAMRDWVCKINVLAYEIDDILDECASHLSKLKLKYRKLNRYSLQQIMFRHNIGRRMKKVMEKLAAVAAERANFHLREIVVETQAEVASIRETSSILDQSHQVYGRDEDKEKIIDTLLNRVAENQEMSVLPIVGVGGLGKTTVAQLVFNDPRVVEHFEKKLWVCVSDNFDIKTLVKMMIESATKSGCASDLEQLDTLQHRLRELLNQKRYLIVLDDVWNTDQEKWFLLKKNLACGSNGTSIIVTTRVKKVADIMGTLPAHCLTELSEEYCWMLLMERAFREEEREGYPNLEAIGKQIVKKCAGVPMAAKALGGLLRFKRMEKEWIYVRDSQVWNISTEENLILPALRLSYHHLPMALRQCFAYFAVFPKDFSIKKRELTFLWMAHGYISSRGEMEVEDAGNDICNELVLRSLLQYDQDQAITMHDLVHDLAQSIMESKVPGVQVGRQVTSTRNSRIRQVILWDKSVAFPIDVQPDMDISAILAKFGRLRVLDASYIAITDLPSTVGNLKHLRYLNLFRSSIRILPNSLCGLWNLQTLNLSECTVLVELPKNMRCLNNLRHLYLENCISLRRMPFKIGELPFLKTLSLFVVGCNRGYHLEELQCLNLSGRLEIKHLETVETYMDAKRANLVQKKDLRCLILRWEREGTSKLWEEDEKVLEALQPHPNLDSLRITGFGGRSFPVWVAYLEKVVDIDIADCEYCLRLPQLGMLPHLKFLKLDNLAVEYIVEDKVQSGNILFPSLEKLSLWSLPHLKGLLKEQANTKMFPELVNLFISDCSSFILPELSSIQDSTLGKVDYIEIENCQSCLQIGLLGKLPRLKYLRLAQLRVEYMIEDKVEVDVLFPSLEGMELTSLPNLKRVLSEQANTRVLPKLERLRIDSCSSLVLPELSSLQDLAITNCSSLMLSSFSRMDSLISLRVEFGGNMKCIPTEALAKLSNLKSLEICMLLEQEIPLPDEGLRSLKSLTSLSIVLIETLTCLPEGLRHLFSLKYLYIGELSQLNSLPDWLDNLTSLHTLEICAIPKLVSLPACIQGMQNLQHLSITYCPELERRCQRGTGEDWHKTSHIPKLEIGRDD